MSVVQSIYASPNRLSLGGLWVFLPMLVLLGYAFTTKPNRHRCSGFQAGSSAVLNCDFNLHLQGHSRHANKAVTRRIDALWPCAYQWLDPCKRGREGPT